MIQLDDKLISEDIFSEEFVCNLSKCKGIYGRSDRDFAGLSGTCDR
jgi:hypothetical protein